jgi:hypothetical protein
MNIYQQTNLFLENCFKKIEKDAPRPEVIILGSINQLRYKDKRLEIAILQKLARYISGLNSSLILLDYGYTQEMGVLFRTLDEFQEDIVFLCIPLNENEEESQLHKDYLMDFYQEEFDVPDNAFLSSQNRKTIPRKKIHAALARILKNNLNPSDTQQNIGTLSQLYSGYVHGTSVHILDMINPNDFQYYLSGMYGTYRQDEFYNAYWSFAYRGIVTMLHVSKTFGYHDIAEECLKFRDYFEGTTKSSGRGDTEKLLRQMKSKSPKSKEL